MDREVFKGEVEDRMQKIAFTFNFIFKPRQTLVVTNWAGKFNSCSTVVQKATALFLLFFTTALFLSSCNLISPDKERLFKKSTVLMDTIVSITVVSTSRDRAEKAINEAFRELKRLEDIMNFYSEESEVSRINRNAGIRPVKVSMDMIDIIEKAIYVSRLTDGAFDITTGPLTRLWDFQNNSPFNSPSYGKRGYGGVTDATKKVPEPSEIRKALRLVNYRDIVINQKDSTVFLKRKGMLIDLGGIAKGYGADRAMEILKKNGINSCLVAIAGDIKVSGRKPDGSPWVIGIRHPRAEKGSDDIFTSLPLTDAAISTSGDYERFFIKNGKRYHHIINPFTGYPSEHTGGVSVITEEGYLSDSLATAVFVLGPEKGMELLKRLGYKGIFITGDLKTYE
jgi:thiamine biosynthesis lipoprotein